MDSESRGQEKQKNFPEDVLNLELKFLDENVRPYIINVTDAWSSYMMGKTKAHNITINIQALLFQLRPVQRLTEFELEGFEKRCVALSKMATLKKYKEFNTDIISLINDINDKIGECKMFARPSDDDGTSGGFASLLKEMAKEEKEKADG